MLYIEEHTSQSGKAVQISFGGRNLTYLIDYYVNSMQ